MKNYTTPEISITELTVDIITASDIGDTPMTDLNW